ncbi:G-type lectin S-receptor-like serine/threonine-protein kinase At4g27290 isoform X1 [Rhododendron vialii]|uniref:G-type lectin S-receptor-like serine/threonine-protein kinase At4g27290 isoform X1 n=2 Tax=Rhododendron vialii TaxID=182163 RepID=UPI00265EE3ED|nr:G-type lectin S-receptor-like serine/threonine-protein kinase At4g27290 isoform X1 [Rhododendron vialii]
MERQAFLTFFHALFFSSTLLKFSIAADTLSSSQSLRDGETLVSPGQKFELGFFSPGSSKNRYLGIWYVRTPDTVVWVANRNNPMIDVQGILAISSDGGLILRNGTQSIIWSSNSTRASAEEITPIAQLLDSGNLELIERTKTYSVLWQSFDSMCDTRLPGMKLGANTNTGLDQHMTSWKAADDPSPGDFTYRIENNGLPQLVITMGSTKKYRSGPWNGLRFSGHQAGNNPAFKPVMEFNNTELISFYEPFNSVIKRSTLSQSGYLQRYVLNEKSGSWDLMFTAPADLCDSYGQCGPNGICRTSKAPICECLKGFSPKSQLEWEMLNWSKGCVRSVPLKCQKGEGFVKVARVKLPDLLDQFQLNTTMSLRECKEKCLRDCSCIAYANSNVSGRGNGCLMWFGDLIDTREFVPQDDSEQDIYIRLPESLYPKKKKKRLLKILLLSATSGTLTFCFVCGCIIIKMNKKRSLKGEKENLELPVFDLATISAATRNFSQENMVGEGGFGPVYKGKLSMGQEIAVKRLSKSSGQGLEEFKNEVASIAILQHRNLVALLGCCIQGEETMLIYEYMSNKSLDYFIYDHNRKALLAWQKRFDIIMGIARGLLYLHQDSKLKIIHRDLKASNILLDGDLLPKISDFGLARIFAGEQISAKTKRIIGTYGYMSPEYAIDGKFSVKSDVFSLGVLLLEIVSGKRNRGFIHPDHHHSLLGHAWLLWNEDKSLELMDTCLKDSCVESEVQRCIQVGLLCIQKLPEDRPAMSTVVFMLGNEGGVLPMPKEPGFFIERSSIDESYTNDAASITTLEAR